MKKADLWGNGWKKEPAYAIIKKQLYEKGGGMMDKKEKAIRSIRDLILKKGIQGASMAKVSAATQIPVGTIYNLFHSKEEMIETVYLYCRSSLVRPGGMDFSGMSFQEALRKNMRGYMEHALKHPKDFLFVQEYSLSPVIRQELRMDANVTMSSIPVRTAVENGLIKDLEPEFIACVLLGIVNQALSQHFSGTLKLADGDIDRILDVAWDAIRA